MKIIILAFGAFLMLATSPVANAAQCYWDGFTMRCSTGWGWHEQREWRDEEWRERERALKHEEEDRMRRHEDERLRRHEEEERLHHGAPWPR